MIYLFTTANEDISRYEVHADSMEEAIDRFSEMYIHSKNRKGIELAKRALHTMGENVAMEILNMAIGGNLHTIYKISNVVWGAYRNNDNS